MPEPDQMHNILMDELHQIVGPYCEDEDEYRRLDKLQLIRAVAAIPLKMARQEDFSSDVKTIEEQLACLSVYERTKVQTAVNQAWARAAARATSRITLRSY
jgi:hypothetical protein